MIVSNSQACEIRQILAADQRFGKVNSQDDQIWELTTSRGEPPALALQTTYGLRAYGIRVFPRFVTNKSPISDPRAFHSKPVVSYSAPNFSVLTYSPLDSIDVVQKVWVPDSHTLIGQITLTNKSDNLVHLDMEWVVLLKPLGAGSFMNPTQISVNTVLQGQTQHLFPVFFLTGGPQGNFSAMPSLGIEITFTPSASRQFSWALASLDSVDASFYAARKSTAYSLDNEQLKIEMLQKQQSLDFQFDDPSLNRCLTDSQNRVFQLLMPPFQKLAHPSFVNSRLPDHGFDFDKYGNTPSEREIQRITELWELSRFLLPHQAQLLEEILQNLIDHQAMDGTIHAQVGYHGNITNLAAAPLVSSISLEIAELTNDHNWITRSYPALVRSVRIWFSKDHDIDQDGFPEWQHPIQTGQLESARMNSQKKTRLDALVKTAEWPSLAALLINECRALLKIANMVDDNSETEWLQETLDHLTNLINECWDEKTAGYRFREKTSHHHHAGKTLHTFKQDGDAQINYLTPIPTRIFMVIRPRDGMPCQIKCQIKGFVDRHEKVITLSAKAFDWDGEQGFTLTKEFFSEVRQITISGIKKGDICSVEIPDLSTIESELIIPLWAGIADQEKALRLIKNASERISNQAKGLPLFLKIMWIEGLIQYGDQERAALFFKQWFLPTPASENLSTANISGLIPINTMLRLLNIIKLTDEEIIIQGFNHHLPKVNVQYKKFLFEFQDKQTRIQHLNGESVLITEEDTHRIILS